jgi:SAM-dependent methyltransferase
MSKAADDERCLRGEALYGNDFDSDRIANWYAEEAEAYAALGAGKRENYAYAYHGLNRHHGFRHLPKARFRHVLGLGSAYGDELEPIVASVDRITIVDPSAAFAAEHRKDMPITYVQPHVDGHLALADASVDLAVSFGALHHIPNVGFVLREIGRVLATGGWLLLREPVVSMGDWRQPRPGLTRHERGIPLPLLRDMLNQAGLQLRHEALVEVSPCTRVLMRLGIERPFDHDWAVRLDAALGRLLGRNLRYHATGFLDRLRPSSAFVVARKSASTAK